MLQVIYIKKKKSLPKFNCFECYTLLSTYNELSLYNYFKYIKFNKTNITKFYLNYVDSYNLNKTIYKSFNLINTYSPKLYIQDSLYNKYLLIHYTYSKLNYFFLNNILINKNILTQINHRHYITYPNIFLNSKKLILNFLNIYKLNKEYIYLTTYYNYWKNISTTIYNIYGNILTKNKTTYSISSLQDITSGLISIETIFESRTLPNKYLIPKNLSILYNIYISYEETILSYIKYYNMYTIKDKKILLFTNLNTTNPILIENKTAIVLPNNIITSGNYSANSLILKLFSHNLNYYLQDEAIKLSHIFMFNLIVESLLKQYFKNGIIIPSIQFELIVKKMTSFVKLNYVGDSSLLENDILDFSKLEVLNYTFYKLGFKQLIYFPIILGISKSILASSGYLASISFQEIVKYLIKLSIESTTDWLTDLKSKIITTDLIKTGTGWYRHFIKI